MKERPNYQPRRGERSFLREGQRGHFTGLDPVGLLRDMSFRTIAGFCLRTTTSNIVTSNVPPCLRNGQKIRVTWLSKPQVETLSDQGQGHVRVRVEGHIGPSDFNEKGKTLCEPQHLRQGICAGFYRVSSRRLKGLHGFAVTVAEPDRIGHRDAFPTTGFRWRILSSN